MTRKTLEDQVFILSIFTSAELVVLAIMLAMLVFHLQGCATVRPAHHRCEAQPSLVVGSANLTDAELEGLRVATEAWPQDFVFAGRAPWAPDAADAPLAGLVIVGRPDGDFDPQTALARAIYLASPDGCIHRGHVLVYFAEGEYDADRAAVIFGHELGHLTGKDHGRGLMSSSLPRIEAYGENQR